MDYECKITAKTRINAADLFILEGVEVDFSCKHFDAVMSKQGLTPFGYALFTKAFAAAVSNFAKSAGRLELSEGMIIEDVVKELEANLVDAEMKEPTAEAGTRD